MGDNGANPRPYLGGGGYPYNVMLNIVTEHLDQETFVDGLIMALSNDAYAARLLYEPIIKHRCTIIARHNPPLFRGVLMQAIAVCLRAKAPEWEREILRDAPTDLPLVPLSSIAPEEVDWLWEPYIPFGKLTLVEGDPSVGKTYLLLAIAAAITNGHALPDQDGHVGTPTAESAANVLYITAEDGLADTIRPRAEKVGANLDRLFVPTTMQAFSLADPTPLDEAITRYHTKLVILDPLQAFLGAEMDMHRANEVRPLMTALGSMAAAHHCALLAIRHWTKAIGGRARYRGQGNIDFTAAARSVLCVGESPEDERLRIMAQSKNSLGPYGCSIVFEISGEGLRWAGTSELTADDLAQMQPTKRQHQRKDAVAWLKAFLHDGPQPAEVITTAAGAVGISERTLRRAKENLRILSAKEKETWFWRLPTFQRWERERYPGQEDEHDDPF